MSSFFKDNLFGVLGGIILIIAAFNPNNGGDSQVPPVLDTLQSCYAADLKFRREELAWLKSQVGSVEDDTKIGEEMQRRRKDAINSAFKDYNVLIADAIKIEGIEQRIEALAKLEEGLKDD